LEYLYEGELDAANPVNLTDMRYRSILECIRNERRLHPSPWSRGFVARVLEILIAVWAFRHDLPPLLFDAHGYRHSLAAHSD
jgi:hypothetical protein